MYLKSLCICNILRIFGHDVSAKVDEFLGYKDRNVSFGLGAYFWLTIGVLISWAIRRWKLMKSGRHKKYDGSLSRFPQGNGNMKFRDS